MMRGHCHSSCSTVQTDEQIYGFNLINDKFYYTADPDNTCCATRVQLVEFDSAVVTFKYVDSKSSKIGQIGSKPRLEFMQSSWLDKSP